MCIIVLLLRIAWVIYAHRDLPTKSLNIDRRVDKNNNNKTTLIKTLKFNWLIDRRDCFYQARLKIE